VFNIDEKKVDSKPKKLKAYLTNAGSEIYKTESEANLPLSSDHTVEEARDWVNNGSRL